MMKKLIFGVLLIGMLFSGCAGNAEDMVDDTSAFAETTVAGLYLADSAVETDTAGAVRRYDLFGSDYRWLSAIGDKPLLAQKQTDGTCLTLLTGMEGVPVATVTLSVDLSADDACWQVVNSGFAYYDPQTGEVVFLDPQLQALMRIALPADMIGMPVISPDGGQVFYCTNTEIRALDTEHRISRIIKAHDCAEQKLLGSYFDGQLLGCRVTDLDGRIKTLYLSTENGQTVASDNNPLSLTTYENSYFALRQDGVVQQMILGDREGAPQQMNAQVQCMPALELGGIVGHTAGEDGISVGFYRTDSGKKTAEIRTPGFEAPQAVLADRWSGCLWLLTTETETGASVLLRWDLKKSEISDETVYTGKLYTAEEPDEQGLKDCQKRVDTLNKEHGVTIRIWEKAIKSNNGNILEPEHQVLVISRALDAVENTLNMFPKNFLYKSVNRTIRICIVRSVNSQVASVRYWYDSDPFIVLSASADIQTELLKGIGYVVDSHVLGNSAKLDYWGDLNPDGFSYTDESTYAPEYLTGETMAFMSQASMASAADERMEIFLQAMLPDNWEKFQSETMQQKLLLLCQGIREAWRLQWKSDTYPWEQYLHESLAY